MALPVQFVAKENKKFGKFTVLLGEKWKSVQFTAIISQISRLESHLKMKICIIITEVEK